MAATARTRIKARLTPRWPSLIQAGDLISASRSGSTLTFSFSLASTAVAVSPLGTWRLPIYDPTNAVYRYITVSDLAAVGTVTLSQISDMHADKRTFNAAAWPGGASTFLAADGTFDALTSSLLTDSTATGRSLLGAADAAAARTTLGFDEAVDDRVGSLLVAGTGISLTYNDAGNSLTVAASGTGGVAFAGLVNNAELSASVGSSALTIALKTHAGTDPAAGDPVAIAFQAADGTAVTRTITAATSLVISSGSTLGTANSTAFRFWVVAFDDAGTVRLGVINCRDSSNNIYPLGGYGIASSTAEGGAGAADSAHVFYTGTAVTSKAYTVLGYVEYTSGLGTAGTYSGGPNRTVLHQRGMKLPGDVVQRARTQTSSTATGTTTIPSDLTIPQNTEGDQYMTQAITPNSAANLLHTRAQWIGAHSAGSGSRIIVALFEDSVADALAATWVPFTGNNEPSVAALDFVQIAGTTSATTHKIRAGSSSAGTTYFNGNSTGALLGVMNSYLQVEEIMA